MFIDVHCHLDLCDKKAVANANKANVKIIVSNGTDLESNRKVLELSKDKCVKAALGIYPIEAVSMSDKEIDNEIEFIIKNKENVSAIGEVGLDLKENQDLETQKKNLQKFINLAVKLDKPIIIHSRKAELPCIEQLEKSGIKKVIMHCFSGKMSLVERIAKNGWFLSLPANITFSEHFQNVAKKIDIDNLLCETDSPYLHPRKERDNEPANVVESYKKIAEIKNMSLKEVELKIEDNFNKLFKI